MTHTLTHAARRPLPDGYEGTPCTIVDSRIRAIRFSSLQSRVLQPYMRYFIYCRKSSESEDRQVASIESQLATLKRTFGDHADMQVVGVYEESFQCQGSRPPEIWGDDRQN